MKYRKITNGFDVLSKICAVMIAPALLFSTAATVILFPLVVIFNLAAGNIREKFDIVRHNPVVWVFLAFCIMFLVGAIYSTAPWTDILLIWRKYSKFLFGILLLPLFTDKRWRTYAINAFLVAIFLLVVASYSREFGLLKSVAHGAAEVFKPSIEFNFLLAFAAYLCLFKIACGSCYRYRLVWIIFLGLIVYTVLFRSYGRSGYFVFIGLITLFFVQKMRWRGLIIAGMSAMLLVALAYTFSPVFKSRMVMVWHEIKTYNQQDLTSVGARITFAKNSINLIKHRPTFGFGTGSFITEYAAISPVPSTLTHNPHNEYLYITVQFGVLGLTVLLLFFGVPLWYSRLLPDEEKYVARGVITGIMLGCFANSWLLDITEGSFYAYFIPLAFAALTARAMREKTLTS